MGLIITPQKSIEEYFERNDLSKSLMTALLKNAGEFVKRRDTEFVRTNAMIIGSAVDTILTGEKGQFEKEYYISEIEKKPSPAEMRIIETVFYMVLDEVKEGESIMNNIHELSFYEEFILAACIELDWNAKHKDETKIKNIIKVGAIYFEDLKKSYGKTIISVEDKMTIDSIVMSLATNPTTSSFFNRDAYKQDNEIDIYYQLPIYFNYRDIDCKSLLDIVIVFKDSSGEIQRVIPIDLKTMEGDTLHFIHKLKMFRYDIQASWYTLALSKYFDVSKDVIENFGFIVESTTLSGRPLHFNCTDELLSIGKSGREELTIHGYLIQKKIKGYDDLIDDFIWHEKNGWEQEKVVAESSGVLELGWNGIIEKNESEYKITTL